jgi:hypothetical protein
MHRKVPWRGPPGGSVIAAAAQVPPPLRFRRPALPPHHHALCFPLPNDFFAILSPAIATTGICDLEEKLLKFRLINNDIDSTLVTFADGRNFSRGLRDHIRKLQIISESPRKFTSVCCMLARWPARCPATGRWRSEVCLMTGWGWRNDGANIGRA